MNTIDKIQAVLNTLDQITVAGHENWNMLLGCWQTLQEVKKEMMRHETDGTALQQRNPEDTADSV